MSFGSFFLQYFSAAIQYGQSLGTTVKKVRWSFWYDGVTGGEAVIDTKIISLAVTECHRLLKKKRSSGR